jgi:hypothetical protein
MTAGLVIAGLAAVPAVAQRAPGGWAYDMIRADDAQALGYTGAGVRVAILDNGIDPRALGITGKVVGSFNAVQSFNGTQEHGTATAGIVAAETYAEAGIGGIAPDVEILNVKVCTQSNCRTEAMNLGLKWAIDNGADVVNMSIGGGSPDAAFAALIRDAVNAGIVVVAAAGNSACQAVSENWDGVRQRNCTQTSKSVGFPAAYAQDGLISVGSVDNLRKRAVYSNYNAHVDIMAPGTGVATTYPWGPNADFGGTSAAAPVVAGVVALIKEAAPRLTPAQIQAVLQKSTTDSTVVKPDVWDTCTWDATASRWSCQGLSPSRFPERYFGASGVVDAKAAVQLAIATQAKLDSQDSATVAVTSPTSLTVDWSAAGLGTGPYSVKLDGRTVSETVGESVTLTDLVENATYAVTVEDASGRATLPTLATPASPMALSPRALTTVHVYNDYIHLRNIEYSEEPGVLSLSDGTRIPCRYQSCEYSLPSGTFTATYALMDSLGRLSAESNPIQVTSTIEFPAPQNLRVDNITATSVRLSWDPVPGASYYYYYDAGAGAWITTSDTTVSINNLKTGLTNSTRVMVSNSTGGYLGVWSAWAWFYAFPPELPGFDGLMKKRISPTELEIGFTPLPGADRIVFFRSDGRVQYMPASSPVIMDRFNQQDEGKTFTYYIVGIDDLEFGMQYGQISEPITVTVPYSQRTDNLVLTGSTQDLVLGQERVITASTTSGRAVEWQHQDNTCTFNQLTGTAVTVRADVADRDCVIRGNLPETADWKAATAEIRFRIIKKTDAITLAGVVSKLAFGQVVTITATSTSNRLVDWNINCPDVKTVGPNKVQVKATASAGSCMIRVSLPMSSDWSGAQADTTQNLTKATDKISMSTALTLAKRKPLTVAYKTTSGRQLTLVSTSKCTVKRISTNRFQVSSKYTSGSCNITATLPESSTTLGTKVILKVTLR